MNSSNNGTKDDEKKKTLVLDSNIADIAKKKLGVMLKSGIKPSKNKGMSETKGYGDIFKMGNLTPEEESRRAHACATNNIKRNKENRDRELGLKVVSELGEEVIQKIQNQNLQTDVIEVCDRIDSTQQNKKCDVKNVKNGNDDQSCLEKNVGRDVIINSVNSIKHIPEINNNIKKSLKDNKQNLVKNTINTINTTDSTTRIANANINTSSNNTSNSLKQKINDRWGGVKDKFFNNSSKTSFSNKKRRKLSKLSLSNIKKEIELDNFALTLREFAVKLSASKKDLHKILDSLRIECDDNAYLTNELIELIASELGTNIIRKDQNSIKHDMFDISKLTESDFCIRPPIVTIMGHVDHGKTTLLDSLRSSSVILTESGGITQHIGAYQVKSKVSGGIITFIDTPGHEAFTSMRIRGAQVTDIVVLVVAADDGVKEQTIEAINHALASKVPIIVAINKIDKPDIDIEKLKNELLQHGLVVESYGGNVQCVEVSAKNKINLDGLEEAILLQSSTIDLRVPKNFRASGIVLESRLDKRIGNVATFLIKKGTMKVSDVFFIGRKSYGKVKNMKGFDGTNLKVAFPSMPVEVIGLESIPSPGDEFFVCDNDKQLKKLLSEVNDSQLDTLYVNEPDEKSPLTLDMIFDETEKKEIRMLIKADVQGSLEAIIEFIKKIKSEGAEIKILHQGVGAVTQSDLMLAKASDAVVFAFRVKIDCRDKIFDSVKVKSVDVIYSLTELIEEMILGLNKVEIEDEVIGVAEVKQVFTFDKLGMVAGCFIKSGNFVVGTRAKLYRDSRLVYSGRISSLRRFKDIVREVKAGFECGIILDKFSDIKANDIIEIIKNV